MFEEHEQALARQTKGEMRAPGQADEGNEHRYSPRLCSGCITQGPSQVDLCSHNELANSSVALKQKGGKQDG